MKIIVRKPTDAEKQTAEAWPIWTKEVSTFPYSYGSTETCWILEGEVTVRTPEGETSFKAGDWVVFPKGLECTWVVGQPVRKHYHFA
ncbi:MAG: hypothetical protein A2X36_10600 [Elusimicrobia bacterium GWA2_69_24]|nr:MAG: hypothetical protein A2X36_10600 [Elusimicrobia bacterium GWA2_69_24]HBL17904.1 cupin [Elusimicrobiota bacterium]